MSKIVPLNNRHEGIMIFEVTNGNPNGDPHNDGQPRIDFDTNIGLVSDACIKRKVRNYVATFPPNDTKEHEFNIFFKQGTLLNDTIESSAEASLPTNMAKGSPDHCRSTSDWLCAHYYDNRTFGAVVSTGKTMSGSPFGQICGPIAVSISKSYHPIQIATLSQTRCVATDKKDEAKGRTMCTKHYVSYGLYMCQWFVDGTRAKVTGFDQADYDLFLKALMNLFDHDRSASRGVMIVRGLYDFEHVGQQPPGNAAQNAVEALHGCAPHHRLFETIKVQRTGENESPQSFEDYSLTVDSGWDASGRSARFPGVVLHRLIDPDTDPFADPYAVPKTRTSRLVAANGVSR